MERITVITQHADGYYIVTVNMNNSQWSQDTDPAEQGRILTQERAQLVADWMNASLDGRSDPLVLIQEINQSRTENVELKQQVTDLNLAMAAMMGGA